MERVQFQQEQMLPELKDLVKKGLFTKEETKQILRRRTAYELALVRRIPQPSDFLRYAAYESSLDALRQKRAARLPPSKSSKPSLSDYALARRQLHILARATAKFRADLSLWLEYLRTAARLKARALFSRVLARATMLHPRAHALYVLGAQAELRAQAPAAARALLQRGLRMCGAAPAMWREYVRMELGFAESVRRRWAVLGIAPSAENESEVAQRAILDGALVEEVVRAAAKELPTPALFEELAAAVRAYPCTPELRARVLDRIYAEMAAALPGAPVAVRMHATRALDALADSGASSSFTEEDAEMKDASAAQDLHSEAFVEALRAANEELAEKAKGSAGVARAYAAFADEWCARDIDTNLKLYLTASLGALARHTKKHAASAVLAAHLRLSTSLLNASTPPLPPSKLRTTAQKYTALRPHSPDLWLARLNAERAADASGAQLSAAWLAARAGVGAGVTLRTDAEEDADEDQWEARRLDVWLWGLDVPELDTDIETLLRASLADSTLRRAHAALLVRHASLALTAGPAHLDRISRLFLPDAQTWASIFTALVEGAGAGAGAEDSESAYSLLHAAHAHWAAAGGGAEAGVRWAQWLLDAGRGGEAVRAVRAAGKDAEARWGVLLAEREEAARTAGGEEEAEVALEEIEVA